MLRLVIFRQPRFFPPYMVFVVQLEMIIVAPRIGRPNNPNTLLGMFWRLRTQLLLRAIQKTALAVFSFFLRMKY